MKVTLEQVAQKANVSRRTVDRVINSRGNVRPEVEQKVRGVLKELNYQPNKLASALAYSKTPVMIGFIYQKEGFRNFDESGTGNSGCGIRTEGFWHFSGSGTRQYPYAKDVSESDR